MVHTSNLNVSENNFFFGTHYYGWCKRENCRNLLKSVFGEKLKLFEKEKVTKKNL